MFRWIPVFGFFLTAFFADFGVRSVSDNDYLDWSADRKLTWDDFTAKPELGTERAALSSIQIHVDFRFSNNDLKWNILCRFNKKKSWGKTQTDYILAHEQAHFDITEYHARKLHERLQAFKKSGDKDYNRRLQAIYEETMKEENAMQETYDRETKHSIFRKTQEEWLEKVAGLLKDSAPYADYRNQNKP